MRQQLYVGLSLLGVSAVATGGVILGSELALMVWGTSSTKIGQPGEWTPCRAGPSEPESAAKKEHGFGHRGVPDDQITSFWGTK